MSEYIGNIVYGIKSFITGMKLTWSHFVNKKDLVATLQYPNEKWPIPEKNIGFDHSEYNSIRSRLHVDIDDCIACMQCERACPVDCIKIDSVKPPKDIEYDCGMTSNDTQKKMIVSRFTIDMSECMYCNLCVYPCPEECIYMVGGPNEDKHPIDYEFSQYSRDGMIFEFADATDEMIKEAGGKKWIESRDFKNEKLNDGENLKGIVVEEKPLLSKEEPKVNNEISTVSDVKIEKNVELNITSFNTITDKMSRGIAKKVYVSSKRNGKDHIAILSDVSQTLSDAGKMTDDIKSILELLYPSSKDEMNKSVHKEDNSSDLKENNQDASSAKKNDAKNIVEIDIKDLNKIEDKMARGTAKKAFVGAKRTGEDKLVAIRESLNKNNLLSKDIDELLNTFSPDPGSSNSKAETTIKNNESDESKDILFDIKELNKIEDKMARGISKKVYIAGKRNNKQPKEIIEEILISLKDSDKISDAIIQLLNKLKGN
tara:strand:- start:232 stop:1686 length:1455 start_codon:yes stop_codon:yes gene_type:complete